MYNQCFGHAATAFHLRFRANKKCSPKKSLLYNLIDTFLLGQQKAKMILVNSFVGFYFCFRKSLLYEKLQKPLLVLYLICYTHKPSSLGCIG